MPVAGDAPPATNDAGAVTGDITYRAVVDARGQLMEVARLSVISVLCVVICSEHRPRREDFSLLQWSRPLGNTWLLRPGTCSPRLSLTHYPAAHLSPFPRGSPPPHSGGAPRVPRPSIIMMVDALRRVLCGVSRRVHPASLTTLRHIPSSSRALSDYGGCQAPPRRLPSAKSKKSPVQSVKVTDLPRLASAGRIL